MTSSFYTAFLYYISKDFHRLIETIIGRLIGRLIGYKNNRQLQLQFTVNGWAVNVSSGGWGGYSPVREHNFPMTVNPKGTNLSDIRTH